MGQSTRVVIALLLVACLAGPCMAQGGRRRRGASTRVAAESEDGSQSGSATVADDGSFGSVTARSVGRNRASASANLIVVGGSGGRGSFRAEGDSSRVSESVSTLDEADIEEEDLDMEEERQSGGKKKKSKKKNKKKSAVKEDVKADDDDDDDDDAEVEVEEEDKDTFESATVVIRVDGDSTEDRKRVCLFGDKKFNKFLRKGYEVTMVEDAGNGYVRITREYRTRYSVSKSIMVVDKLPKDVKKLCKTPGKKLKGGSRKTKASRSSSSSTSQPADLSLLANLCQSSLIRSLPIFKHRCAALSESYDDFMYDYLKHD